MKRNSKSTGFKMIIVENLKTMTLTNFVKKKVVLISFLYVEHHNKMVLQKERIDLYNKLHKPCLMNTC